MSEQLSQEEVEALLRSMRDKPDEPAERTSSVDQRRRRGPSASAYRGQAIAYEVYDFRRPDKFSKDQLRTLQMLHETYGRLAGSTLSAYLRHTVQIELVSIEQIPYEEYLRSISNSVFAVCSLPPLTGEAVLETEFPIVFTMLDKLLGGPGRPYVRGSLSEIERPLFRQIAERALSSLRNAWEGVVLVSPTVEALETSAQFVQIAPPGEIVISVLFEIRIGDVHGAMSLCIPYMLLKPITTKLSAQKWFAASARGADDAGRRRIVEHLERSEVECAVVLGKSALSVSEFLGLEIGDVLRLDSKAKGEIRFEVGGDTKFYGSPALESERMVLNITQQAME